MDALQAFKQWVYLMQQVHEAKYHIGRAEQLGHPHLWKTYGDVLEFLVHFRGALNSYAKCFVKAGAGRKRLEGTQVFSGNAASLSQHVRLIDLRHKYVAPSDENDFESATLIEEESDAELVIRLQYDLSFPFDRLYELRELIGTVELYIVDRQSVHIESISKNIGKPVRVMQSGA